MAIINLTHVYSSCHCDIENLISRFVWHRDMSNQLINPQSTQFLQPIHPHCDVYCPNLDNHTKKLTLDGFVQINLVFGWCVHAMNVYITVDQWYDTKICPFVWLSYAPQSDEKLSETRGVCYWTHPSKLDASCPNLNIHTKNWHPMDLYRLIWYLVWLSARIR